MFWQYNAQQQQAHGKSLQCYCFDAIESSGIENALLRFVSEEQVPLLISTTAAFA
jgi:hypothetical protein